MINYKVNMIKDKTNHQVKNLTQNTNNNMKKMSKINTNSKIHKTHMNKIKEFSNLLIMMIKT